MKKIIKLTEGDLIKLIKKVINENLETDKGLLSSMPKDIFKILDDNFSHMYRNFDWNTKSNEFRDNGENFKIWIKNHEEEEFIKNKDKITKAVRSDMILARRQKLAEKRLNDMEEYLVSLLGFNITGDANNDTINILSFELFVLDYF